MTGIHVSVAPATVLGRLYPRYDEEAGILAVESKVARRWTYGVDIDGRVVFDLDDRRVLANLDLHVPKPRWSKDLIEEYDTAAPAGDLVFAPETITRKSFNLPLQVRTDRSMTRVKIVIGNGAPDRFVALSEFCIALLAGDDLVGFAIKNFA